MKRVFLIVLDSVGIGEMPDAADYGDAGSNTIRAVASSPYFSMPNMRKLGFFNIDGVETGEKEKTRPDSFCENDGGIERKRYDCRALGDCGHHLKQSAPTYPDGFPQEILDEFTKRTGRGVLCNKPYSGTDVIRDYGEEHMKTGKLIVYTSADSVFQVAAHEDVVPVETLYEYCKIAREILTGENGVGRVIARPFVGTPGNFTRTVRRHDFSLQPPKVTMLDQLCGHGYDVRSVGKIIDIFAEKGIKEYVRTTGNEDGINKTIAYMKQDFEGLCFTNLVDYDMLYGHRNDVEGYAKALTYFDERLPELIAAMRDEDILMITADHGCDPSTPSTDHSREYTPLVMYGKPIREGVNYGTRGCFSDIAATILAYFDIKPECAGEAIPIL